MKTPILAAAALCVALAPVAALAQNRGDWVLAPWRNGAHMYPGVVQSNQGGMVAVRFDDGTSETMPANRLQRFNWRAGTRVACRWRNGATWYNGRITMMGADGATLDVLYDDGDRERTRTALCRQG